MSGSSSLPQSASFLQERHRPSNTDGLHFGPYRWRLPSIARHTGCTDPEQARRRLPGRRRAPRCSRYRAYIRTNRVQRRRFRPVPRYRAGFALRPWLESAPAGFQEREGDDEPQQRPSRGPCGHYLTLSFGFRYHYTPPARGRNPHCILDHRTRNKNLSKSHCSSVIRCSSSPDYPPRRPQGCNWPSPLSRYACAAGPCTPGTSRWETARCPCPSRS